MSASTCVCEREEGITSQEGGEGQLWWPLEMACDPPSHPRKVKNQIRRVRGITNRPCPTPDRSQGIQQCVCHKRTGRIPTDHLLIHRTLFDGPAVRACSSYAATLSHVATTAWVGVNVASGNPRCTSWRIRWMKQNEWTTQRKDVGVQWREVDKRTRVVQMERICVVLKG